MHNTDAARTLAVKYAQLIDDRQFEHFREIMTRDFSQQGPGISSNSIEEFIASLSLLDNYSATFHLVGNQLGEWHNNIYTGETWSVATHIHSLDGVQHKLDMGIRYQDVIENFSGTCKYLSRDLNIIWTQDLPIQG
ncbi:MAG: SnoaL-like domain-containing protein [Halieaceae bacterium]|jgi:hypothetical protein|nr:SnoaL-like domain-containing protein [Halieaceae bacterium]